MARKMRKNIVSGDGLVILDRYQWLMLLSNNYDFYGTLGVKERFI